MRDGATVFDTSVYIPYLRGEAYGDLLEATGRAGRVRLSTVVLTELYAGTRSSRDKSDLDAVWRAYRSLGFLVTATDEDWIRAGQSLRRYSHLYGRIEPREHMNDVLILVSSARVGAEVVSENAASFLRWASLLRRMGSAVRVRGVRRSDHLD